MIMMVLRCALCFPLATSCFAVPQSDSRYAVGTRPGTVAVADFNGDGKAEVVVTSNSQNRVTVISDK